MEAMSDTNQERLLTALLRDLGEADAHLVSPVDLEQRALARWDESQKVTTRSWGRTTVVIAMAAIVLLVIAGLTRLERGAPGQHPIAASIELSAPASVDPEREPSKSAQLTAATSRSIIAHRRRPRAHREVVEFVPLVPMTGAELSGSFQIVRVQMPRAALGEWAGSLALTQADDPIQADLLLGEDGLARAIRVSSDGTSPWRSR
jgi:hypothetical protein